MFENMKTRGGGILSLEFEDEPIEESFRNNFKTEKDFMETLPDELNEISTKVIVKIVNPRNEMWKFINFLTSNVIDKIFAMPIQKFSGPTKEQFYRYIENIDAARKVEENKDEDCRICLKSYCSSRNKSFDEDVYKKAVKEFTKN